MIVLKFGGKSLSTTTKVREICEYIFTRAKTQKVIVVVSAFGNTTDQLIEQYGQYGGTREDTPERDILLSTGELQSAALVCTMLSSMGVSARCMGAREAGINAIGAHGKGIITSIDKRKLNNAQKTHNVIVVAGFQAVDSNNEIITLGRNGSDTTAVAIASAFNTAVEIYSDFDGIYHGDPRRHNYSKIDCINYKDATLLAQSGAPVLSLSSINIAEQSQTPIYTKQASNPTGQGTFVTEVAKPQITISVKDNLSQITINFNGNLTNMQNSLNYIVQKVNFHSFSAKNNKIELIIEQKYAKEAEITLAKLNNLLEAQ